jgi:hypothetical protein
MTALDDAPPLPDESSVPSSPLPPRPRPSLAPPFGWGSLPEESLPEMPAESLPADLPTDDEAASLSLSEDWQDDETGEWGESDGTSSPGSTPGADVPKVSSLVSKHQLRKTAEQAVKIGGGMAHTVAAKTEEAKAVGLYLADDDDARNIGHPLADIMHRRGDVVGGKLSPDANSALQAFLGLAGYLTKQVTKVATIREAQTPQQGQPL